MDPERVRLKDEKDAMKKLAEVGKEFCAKAKAAAEKLNAIAEEMREEERANDVTINPPLTREDYRRFRRQNDRVLHIRIINAEARANSIAKVHYRRRCHES